MKDLVRVLEQYNIPFVTLFDKLYKKGDAIERLHDHMMVEERYYNNMEKQWRKQMRCEHVQFVKEFPDKVFVRKAQKRYRKMLQDRLYRKYKNITDPKERKKIEREIKNLENDTYITKIDIERAKQFPMDQIIEINRGGFAQCVAHDDTQPSMFCKNNFAHCFVCAYTGDTIDVYMQVHGCSFGEAVRSLI